MTYSKTLATLQQRYPAGAPAGINLEDLAQLKTQNTFETHLDIAKAMATEMRKDMARYDNDTSKFTQSLGCWSGFHAMQMMRAIKRQKGTLDGSYVYLSGWMVAGLRNRFGHLPDQSMHEKTSVVDLIQEIYTSLRQADEVELNDLFAELKSATSQKDKDAIIAKIDAHETYVRPIIADIDAGFGNVHATYLLAKEMIKAGACCLQIENQVSDAKQCGHQDGKVTVPREDFVEKLRACRMAFEELGVDDGVIVARTDSLGAGLTQKIPVSKEVGDAAYEYTKWLETEAVTDLNPLTEGDVALFIDDELRKPVNSPSFNWTLNLRKQVREDWIQSGKIKAGDYPDNTQLMSAAYDEDSLGLEADARLKAFQTDIAREAGVFHNLITLPTFHGTAKVMNDLSEGYFGEQKMLAYVKNIQREEIRTNVSAVKHQHEVGSNLGDDFKEMSLLERSIETEKNDCATISNFNVLQIQILQS